MSLTGWTETTVGQTSEFLTGFPFASSDFAETGIRLIRGSNVKRGVIDWSADIARYWPNHDSSLRAFVLRDGDIVIAMDGALVGRSFARITAAELPAYLVQRVARLRGKAIDQDLLYQWIGSQDFVKHVDDVKTHTAIPHISPRDIRDFKISIPTDSNEQRAVSAALRDADDLIATLERIIAKKQAIKQGMMQQLLTGRTRLPGFKAAWRSRPLGELLSYEQPSRYLVSSADYTSTGTPVLTAGKTFVLGHTTERHGIFEDVPVIIFDDFTTASKYVDFPFKAKSSAMKMLSARAGGNLRYIFERMQLIDFVAVDHKRRWIAEFSKIEIDVPGKDEQDAVVVVIEDFDAEIDVLKHRLVQARAIKIGMMQQLLTGRVRLPVETVS